MSGISFEKAAEYIKESAVRGSILGLERMERLCQLLDNPQNSFKVIHVAGTNGKGSTSCYIKSILTKANYKCGMYYSPALTGIKDHYIIGDEQISDEDYACCVEQLIEANGMLKLQTGEGATQFELETALAFLYFRLNRVDAAVIETGLGGRDDATNVIRDKDLCVLTSISLDHMGILGNTIYDISKVKAGIITCNCPVVAFDSGEDSRKAIDEQCRESGSTIAYVQPVNGTYQDDNKAVSVAAAKALSEIGYHIEESDVELGIEAAYWPFRFEKILDNPIVYVDGAHNPDAAKRLRQILVRDYNEYNVVMVLGMFKDKDYHNVIETLAGVAVSVYSITTTDPGRALDASIISDVASDYCDNVCACDSIEAAAKRAVLEARIMNESGRPSMVLACGSLSYLDCFKQAVHHLGGNPS